MEARPKDARQAPFRNRRSMTVDVSGRLEGAREVEVRLEDNRDGTLGLRAKRACAWGDDAHSSLPIASPPLLTSPSALKSMLVVSAVSTSIPLLLALPLRPLKARAAPASPPSCPARVVRPLPKRENVRAAARCTHEDGGARWTQRKGACDRLQLRSGSVVETTSTVCALLREYEVRSIPIVSQIPVT
ncbi:hypothetical protein DFH06DRAFT_1351043 [Mycena polygramma]|nr:hypothetical protein DFH06DRAFT_1351043 [Mycena polygramma]